MGKGLTHSTFSVRKEYVSPEMEVTEMDSTLPLMDSDGDGFFEAPMRGDDGDYDVNW